MANFYMFKAGDQTVLNAADINRDRLTVPTPLYRAVQDGKTPNAQLQWEEIGRFVEVVGPRGNKFVDLEWIE